jgi:hypothetical protein
MIHAGTSVTSEIDGIGKFGDGGIVGCSWSLGGSEPVLIVGKIYMYTYKCMHAFIYVYMYVHA